MQNKRNLIFILTLPFLFLSLSSEARQVKSVSNGLWFLNSTWDLGVPGPTDSVLIDGHTIDISSNATVMRLKITNQKGTEGKLNLLLLTNLVVNGELLIEDVGNNNNVSLNLYTTSQITVNGLLNVQRSASNTFNNKVQIYLTDDAQLHAQNGLLWNYQNSGSENTSEIRLDMNSFLEVYGPSTFYKESGADLTIKMNWASRITFHHDLVVELKNNGNLVVENNSSNDFKVEGNSSITHSGISGNIELYSNLIGNLHFEGDLDLNTSSPSQNILLQGSTTFSDIKVDGDINFNNLHDGTVSIVLNSFADLTLGGDLIRTNGYGSLEMSNDAKLILNGTTPQVIPATTLGVGLDSFNITNLKISNTSGTLTMEGPLLLTKSLELTSSIIQTTSTNTLTLADQADIIGGSTTSFIDGPITKIGRNGGSSFTFPVGKNGIYAPVKTTPVSDEFSEYTVEYFRAAPPAGTPGAGVVNISALEYWSYDMTPGSEVVGLTFFWSDATNSGISDLNDLVVLRNDEVSNTYENTGNGGTTGSASAGQSGSITHDGACPPPCCHFIMTLGSISANNALPLELDYMYAQKTGKKVKIVWETSDELQMKKYTIERSFDGVSFEQIGEVEAKGQTGKQVYEEIDHFPSPGDNYYRLKMISLQDQSQFSQIATVHFAPEAEVEIFPNPVVDKFQISGLELDEGISKIEIINQMGQKIFQDYQALEHSSPMLSAMEMNIQAPGIYYICITNRGQTSILSLVKK